MPLTNSEYEWEFLKALLADPYSPDAGVILRLDATDFTVPNRAYFRYLQDAYKKSGSLDAGAFIELATDHDMDQMVRSRLLELVSEVQDIPFPLARMAENVVWLKNHSLAAMKLEKAIKGPAEDMESTIRESLGILEGSTGLMDAPTLEAEWEAMAAGHSLVTPEYRRPRLVFGLPLIDDAIQTGPGNLGVIAAKPSAGKSSLALQAALTTARSGIGTMFLGLEMPRQELASRAIAWETGIHSTDLLKGHTITGLGPAPAWIKNLHVYDKIPRGAFDEAAALIRKGARQGIQTVIVDYWTLIYPPDTKVRGAGSAYLLGEMSRGFKQLSKETGTHIVLVSQFNREVKDAERPNLENLRETGQLEQDASWVLMLWTEFAQYAPLDQRGVWVELMKNRGGPRWVKQFTKFNPCVGTFTPAAEPENVPSGNGSPSLKNLKKSR